MKRRPMQAVRREQQRKLTTPSRFAGFLREVLGPQPSPEERSAIAGDLHKKFHKNMPLSELQGLWNKHARIYNKLVLHRFMEHEFELILKHVDLSPADKIASIGSGNAVIESFLAREAVPQGMVYCVDLAHEMSKLAKQSIAKAGAKNILVLTASGTRLPFSDSTVNKVFAIQSNLPDTVHWPGFLKEARRVLVKDRKSRFVVSFISESDEEVKRTVESMADCRFVPETIMNCGEFKNAQGKASAKAMLIIAKPVIL